MIDPIAPPTRAPLITSVKRLEPDTDEVMEDIVGSLVKLTFDHASSNLRNDGPTNVSNGSRFASFNLLSAAAPTDPFDFLTLLPSTSAVHSGVTAYLRHNVGGQSGTMNAPSSPRV